MALPIIGVFAFTGMAASSPFVSRPGFLPVQKNDASINILPFVPSSPTSIIAADHRPRIKVTINPTSKTQALPTWWPVDPKVNAIVPVSTSTPSTNSTSVEVSALAGVVAASSTTTTSSTTVSVVVPLGTSSNTPVVIVQPSSTLTIIGTPISTTAVTSAASVTPAAATPSVSANSSSAVPLATISPLLLTVPLGSSSSVVSVTPVVPVTASNFLFTPNPSTATTTATSASTSPTSTVISTPTPTTLPWTFDEVVEKLYFHDRVIDGITQELEDENIRVSDRFDEVVKDLKALAVETKEFAHNTSDGFYRYKDGIEELVDQNSEDFREVHQAINDTKRQFREELDSELHRLFTLDETVGIFRSQLYGKIYKLTERIEYLESENWKWNHEGGHDPVDARLEALEEQNAYLKQKLEEFLGAEKDAPAPIEEQPEDVPVGEGNNEEKPTEEHQWPSWFEGVWNGEKKH